MVALAVVLAADGGSCRLCFARARAHTHKHNRGLCANSGRANVCVCVRNRDRVRSSPFGLCASCWQMIPHIQIQYIYEPRHTPRARSFARARAPLRLRAETKVNSGTSSGGWFRWKGHGRSNGKNVLVSDAAAEDITQRAFVWGFSRIKSHPPLPAPCR